MTMESMAWWVVVTSVTVWKKRAGQSTDSK